MSPWRVLFSMEACSGLMPPAPRIPPRDLERISADTPRERDGPERSDQAGKRSEDSVLEQQHLGDRPRVRAERLEDRCLVDPLELGHRDGADENQRAAEQHEAADN